MSSRKFTAKKDIIIILVILVIAVIVGGFFFLKQKPEEGLGVYAEITENGEVLFQLPLDTPIVAEIPDHPEVKIEVKNESAGFIHSDCPDQICVASGFLSRPGHITACLPNGVVLEIKTDQPDTQKDQVDIVA